jgi:hypothetical protein
LTARGDEDRFDLPRPITRPAPRQFEQHSQATPFRCFQAVRRPGLMILPGKNLEDHDPEQHKEYGSDRHNEKPEISPVSPIRQDRHYD